MAVSMLQVQVTDQPLTSLEMMDNGRIAAVGSADGSTTIVQFSDGLVDMQPNEKQALTSVSQLHCTMCMWKSRNPVSSCANHFPPVCQELLCSLLRFALPSCHLKVCSSYAVMLLADFNAPDVCGFCWFSAEVTELMHAV